MSMRRIALLFAFVALVGCEQGNPPTAPVNPNPGANANAPKAENIKPEAAKRGEKNANAPAAVD